MIPKLLPISALVATRNRPAPLCQMLTSLAHQSVQPLEIIIVDASTNAETQKCCTNTVPTLATEIFYYRALEQGAAVQRNQAMHYATQSTIWFLDDDVIFEDECLEHLWGALHNCHDLGGVNAIITNQRYSSPGLVSRWLFRILQGHSLPSYAGKCIGPAFNLLPEDRPDLPEIVPVEWLNTTCTLYRRSALPNPLFPPIFTGYSLMEDAALSLIVGKKWKLANVRTARILHNSQPGDHKSDPAVIAKMELVNRHYVMTKILDRTDFSDYIKLAILQIFYIMNAIAHVKRWNIVPAILWGKIAGIYEITRKTSKYHDYNA